MVIMTLIHVIAFIILVMMLALYFEEEAVTVLPMAAGILILMLYGLAFLRHLSAVDVIAIFFTVFSVVFLVLKRKQGLWKRGVRKLIAPSFLTIMLLLVVVTICVSQKTVTWWDDINFWATDVKSLYFLNGFATKYTNVSPEFGDYPPAAQLFKWWFLHFSPHNYREGLAFAGYYTLNLIFLAPLLKNVKGKNPFLFGLFAIALWWLPSITEIYGYQGFCADLSMACVYGNILYSVIDSKEHKESFYYGRIALYLGILVLIKSVGFIWAAFGIVFLLLYMFSNKMPKKGLWVIVAPVITGGSWFGFCMLMRRVTKTTATAVKYITTDEYGFSGYMGDFARAFMEAFFTLPLHKARTIAVDLTPFAFYLVISFFVIFFYRKKLMPQRMGRLVLWFSILSGAVFYAIIFLAHITIFATETQYLEATGMISSIERYGAPFTVGTLLFLMLLWMDHGPDMFTKKPAWLQRHGTTLCIVLMVALTGAWQIGYDGLIGYRESLSDAYAEKEHMLDENAKEFLLCLKEIPGEEGARVLCVQTDQSYSWVRNSYTSYEASPVSVVYIGVNLKDATHEWLCEQIQSAHANYMYVAETDVDIKPLFEKMLTEGEMQKKQLYRVNGSGNVVQLFEVKENTQ